MGNLGLRLKWNISFFTELQFLQCLVIVFGLFNLSVCLFEDQIGKFDWKQEYVGKLKYSSFDSVGTVKRIIIATEENVIAALNLKSGQILWRQVLEKANQGQIQHLSLHSKAVTISGVNPLVVRNWEVDSGRLLSEWSLTLLEPEHVHSAKWLVRSNKLYQVIPVRNSHVEVTVYNADTGANKGSTTKITGSEWTKDVQKCILAGPYFACKVGAEIHYFSVTDDKAEPRKHSIEKLEGFGDVDEIKMSAVVGTESVLLLSNSRANHVVTLSTGTAKQFALHLPAGASLHTIDVDGRGVLLTLSVQEGILKLSGRCLVDGTELQEYALEAPYPQTLGYPEISTAFCIDKKDKGLFCRVILATDDEAIAVLHKPGKIFWIREESLANIIATEFIDLPVSDSEASIEQEFDSKEGDVFGMFAQRIASQVTQLQTLVLTVLGLKTHNAGQKTELVKDEFGLHKMIVIVTSVGKVFGVDNLGGKIWWQKKLRGVEPFMVFSKQTMLLMVQRTPRHVPHPAQCTVIGIDEVTKEGVLYTFNPITGDSIAGGEKKLGYKIKQVLLLQQTDKNFLKPIVFLDENNKVHIEPASAIDVLLENAKKTFIFTADASKCVLTGYSLVPSGEKSVNAMKNWEMKLCSLDQKLTHVVGKIPTERVHSQGRVLGDRSVLYKYINPNLVAVVTQGPDPRSKSVINVHLVDAVSGAIIHSVSHKKAKGPVHVVHSENWLVYSYYCYQNDKVRRHEVASLELYEGPSQSNSTAFSSLAATPMPHVNKQAYFMPVDIEAMQVTLTEKGITSKHILMGLSTGDVLEMPYMLLDPRRPPQESMEPREEGVVTYIPVLPVMSEAVINYNQTIIRVKGIHTAPSSLESTSLVLIHGLDIFQTRVTPSKSFDLLKDDFDHFLIVIVLAALLIASYITRRLASSKALKQAWK